MSEFFNLYGQKLLIATGQHLLYVVVSVAIAFVIAVMLGILLSRIPRCAKVILPIISVFQTIPGIVFIALLLFLFGMVPQTVITALAIYAIFPILKNTYVGIIEVPKQYKDAAKGCGMSSMQRLWKVELPLALPNIIGGLRMSTIYTVSWAVLASMIGMGGLGDFVYIGVSTNNNTLIIAGAIPAAVMAVALSGLISLLQRSLTPKALRRNEK